MLHFRLYCRTVPTAVLSPSSKRRCERAEGEVGDGISSLSRAGLGHVPLRVDVVVFASEIAMLTVALMAAERLAGNSP